MWLETTSKGVRVHRQVHVLLGVFLCFTWLFSGLPPTHLRGTQPQSSPPAIPGGLITSGVIVFQPRPDGPKIKF